MDVTIRTAKSVDRQSILQLHEAVWRDTYCGFPEAFVSSTAEMERENWVRGAQGVQLVAESNGEVVAFGVGGTTYATVPDMPASGMQNEIQAVYVRHGFRYRGIGTRLVTAMMAWFSLSGVSRVGFRVAAANVAAVVFARALGAVVVADAHWRQCLAARGPVAAVSRVPLMWSDISALANAGTKLLPGLAAR